MNLFDFISKCSEQISKRFAKNETASSPVGTDRVHILCKEN
jgi:hypothetical protein